jgi:hypothetical protein
VTTTEIDSIAKDPLFDNCMLKNSLPRKQRICLSIIFSIILSGVRLSPLGTVATAGLLYQHQMIDDGDGGAMGGMKIGRGN